MSDSNPKTRVRPRSGGSTPASDENAPTSAAPTGDNVYRRPRKSKPPRGERKPPQEPRPPRPKAEPLNTFDDSGDFASLLEEAGGFASVDIRPGDRVEARLSHIGDENAVFELGAGADAWMPNKELPEGAAVGDTLTLTVVRTGDSIMLSKGSLADPAFIEEAKEAGLPVAGKVTGINKGGLEITLTGGLRGFCPVSQVDIGFVEDISSYNGRSLEFLVQSMKGREVVLSRRALLERERRAQAESLKATLHVGAILEGEVRKVEAFGAFVDLGGLDGLLPTSEMGWGVKSADEAVSVGEQVRVEVIRVEPDDKRPDRLRITLSRRALERDPLQTRKGELAPGTVLEGKVSRLEDFGAFIEIGDGLEGLVHISEMSAERVRHPKDVVEVGAAVSVRVLSIDEERRRISLSLRDPGETARRQAQMGKGELVTGVVTRHEKYGVFVELKEHEGVRALLPAPETGTERGADLRRAFPIGAELALAVLEVDDRGRVRVSITERERAEEREVVKKHAPADTGGFGTFGDLLKGALK